MGVMSADRVRTARRIAGLSQEQLAQRANTRNTNISAIEQGRRVPTEEMLARLLTACDVKPSRRWAANRQRALEMLRQQQVQQVWCSARQREVTTDICLI